VQLLLTPLLLASRKSPHVKFDISCLTCPRFEFYTFPAYITNVIPTFQCLQNLKDLTNIWPPLRIGGTTQDRATYNHSMTSQAVNYTVPSPNDAPDSLTFGPSFMELAGTYCGSVVLGKRLSCVLLLIAQISRIKPWP
jgi:hypothetical protein